MSKAIFVTMNVTKEDTALMTRLTINIEPSNCASVPAAVTMKPPMKFNGAVITVATNPKINANSRTIPRVRQKYPRVKNHERRSAANTPMSSIIMAGMTKYQRIAKYSPASIGATKATKNPRSVDTTPTPDWGSQPENATAPTRNSNRIATSQTTMTARINSAMNPMSLPHWPRRSRNPWLSEVFIPMAPRATIAEYMPQLKVWPNSMTNCESIVAPKNPSPNPPKTSSKSA